MISPNEVRDKAGRLFDDAVQAWLEGKHHDFFPYRLRCDLKPRSDLCDTKNDIRALRSRSKQTVGFGYRLEEVEKSSRTLGRDLYPSAIFIDSIEDLVLLIGRESEFDQLVSNIQLIRNRIPLLEEWLIDSWKKLLPRLDYIKDLVAIAEWIMKNPRPAIHTRELPLAISTKIIERHESILSEWLDRLLPADAIDFGVSTGEFEKRYGFRRSDSQISIRVFDEEFANEIRIPCAELMVPVEALHRLSAPNVRVIITENKASLDLVPQLRRTIVMGALGNGIQKIKSVDWLQNAKVYYWGDCDIAGFGILARLRDSIPNVASVMMDLETVNKYWETAIEDKSKRISVPDTLSVEEQGVLVRLIESGMRLEQEKIPVAYVRKAFEELIAREKRT